MSDECVYMCADKKCFYEVFIQGDQYQEVGERITEKQRKFRTCALRRRKTGERYKDDYD